MPTSLEIFTYSMHFFQVLLLTMQLQRPVLSFCSMIWFMKLIISENGCISKGWLFGLEFNGPVNSMRVMSSWQFT